MSGVKFLVVFLAMSSIAFAEISIGADITSSFSNSSTTSEPTTGSSTERKSNQNTFSIAPMIGIFPSKVVEIAPFLRWSISTSSNQIIIEGSTTTSQPDETSQQSLEPGCGAYFHVTNNNNLLDFSLGPKLSYSWLFEPYTKNSTSSVYDKYYYGSLNFGVQTNIDLKFTEHFKTRFFSNLFRLSLLNTHTKYKGATTETRGYNFVSDFRTILQPSFGFHFTF